MPPPTTNYQTLGDDTDMNHEVPHDRWIFGDKTTRRISRAGSHGHGRPRTYPDLQPHMCRLRHKERQTERDSCPCVWDAHPSTYVASNADAGTTQPLSTQSMKTTAMIRSQRAWERNMWSRRKEWDGASLLRQAGWPAAACDNNREQSARNDKFSVPLPFIGEFSFSCYTPLISS
jgi:hypothetical protein